MVYVVVESSRVRPRRNEHHHKRAFLGLVVRFLDPFRKLPSIRRIAKYPFAPPILREAILRLGEVLRAFRILVRAAWIEIKVELCVQLVKQSLRRCPLDGCA